MLQLLTDRYRAETSQLEPGGVYIACQLSDGDWCGFEYDYNIFILCKDFRDSLGHVYPTQDMGRYRWLAITHHDRDGSGGGMALVRLPAQPVEALSYAS